MFETKQQKQYLAVCAILVAVLSFITFRKSPNFIYKEQPQVLKKDFDYKTYLASLKIDEDAGKKLLQQVITEEDIKKEVEKQLDVKQKIISPEIDEKKVETDINSSKDNITTYLQTLGQASDSFNLTSQSFANSIFDPSVNISVIESAEKDSKNLVQQLYSVKVPKEMLPLHKAALTVYEAFLTTVENAKTYAENKNTEPWPKLYNDFVVINDQMSVLRSELKKADQKYKIAYLPIYPNIAKAKPVGLIPEAQAIFGLGDTTFIIGNIPEIIEKAIKEALATAFANFASQFLNKLIAQIEKNYVVANFLYYSDALVRGQYVDDYLNKYVNNTLDKAIVKNFIPQFNCGQGSDLKPVFKAKSEEYLGFDPENLSPNDPDYFLKLGKVGNFLSSANGWQIYYEDMAKSVQTQAEKNVDRELSSGGLKTPRDLIGTKIALSITSIQGSISSIMNAQLNLGVVNVDNIVSSLVKNLVYNLFNKFVFKGAVVYKEQATCLPTPQLSPVIPSADTEYQTPPAPPTEEEIVRQQCEQNPELCNSSTSPRNIR